MCIFMVLYIHRYQELICTDGNCACAILHGRFSGCYGNVVQMRCVDGSMLALQDVKQVGIEVNEETIFR